MTFKSIHCSYVLIIGYENIKCIVRYTLNKLFNSKVIKYLYYVFLINGFSTQFMRSQFCLFDFIQVY